jgi:large subunit ribosomal protein L13
MALSTTPQPVFEPEVINASGRVLGRLATEIATKLTGKDLPSFDPSIVLQRPLTVVNATRVVLTGRKRDQKRYYRHTGYPGGLRFRTVRELEAARPTEILRHAVAGMLPKNRLQKLRLRQLTIRVGEE